jgi:hypothetical protein
LTAAVSLGAAILLVFLLMTKEIISTSQSATAVRVARYLSVAILPLLLAFPVIVVVKIVELL